MVVVVTWNLKGGFAAPCPVAKRCLASAQRTAVPATGRTAGGTAGYAAEGVTAWREDADDQPGLCQWLSHTCHEISGGDGLEVFGELSAMVIWMFHFAQSD